MASNHNPGPIPPRWKHCPRKSDQIIGGKFLAFKTPLDSRYDDQIPLECRFPPSFIFESMKSYRIKIGLWIDLCNTSRFYRREEVEKHGVKYVKLQCRGHGETPSQEQVTTFVNICKNFLSKNPLDIIAVHCTHGFNRTGFMISSFFVESEDWGMEAAVLEFAKARKPGIYKSDYIDELFRRYGDVSDAPAVPNLPDWCLEDEEIQGDDHQLDDDGNPFESSSGRRLPNKKYKSVFMPGVPGVTPFHEEPLLSQLQRRVQQMCGKENFGFPGSQPVSLDNDNIRLLQERPYKVSWKADGTRYMMLLDGKDQIYFIDRDNAFFQVSNLKFLHRKDPSRHLRATLLDGEMVIDEVDDRKFPRYLVYDIVRFEGEPVGQMDFNIRFLCIQKEIVGARHTHIVSGLIDKLKEPFSVRVKEFWDVSETRTLLGPKFTKESLGHEPDGIIFQPVKEPYTSGTDVNVLKWKPSALNSIDFKLRICRESRPGMLGKTVGQLFVGGHPQPFDEMKVTKALKEYDNKIIECSWNNIKREWTFMRERTDKSFPNSFSTANAVVKTIRDPLTEAMLLDFIEKYAWKKPIIDEQKIMMPPPRIPTKN